MGAVKIIINILNDTCSRFGLTISFPKKKTKYSTIMNLPTYLYCFQSGKMW